MVAFTDDVEGRATNDKHAIACLIFCIFVLAIDWPDKTQPASEDQSPESEVRTFYLPPQMFQWIRPILQNIGFQRSNAPNTIYEDIQPTIIIIKENFPTSRFKHITVPIKYVHEKYSLLAIDTVKLKTTI